MSTLIVLEILRAFLSGDLICEKVRSQGYDCEIPIYILDNNEDLEDLGKILNVNCTQYYGAMYCCVKTTNIYSSKTCVWINEQCTGGAGEV